MIYKYFYIITSRKLNLFYYFFSTHHVIQQKGLLDGTARPAVHLSAVDMQISEFQLGIFRDKVDPESRREKRGTVIRDFSG